MKTRTEQQAARHGRPGDWTFDDLAGAQWEANATARPLGLNGPTPDSAWSSRTIVTADERTLFRAEVQRQRTAHDAQGGPDANPETELTDSARERHAIRRALERLGYLTYTRRRILLPITSKKAAIIT